MHERTLKGKLSDKASHAKNYTKNKLTQTNLNITQQAASEKFVYLALKLSLNENLAIMILLASLHEVL